jgi:MoaA/NifB/PqqE/SkfB family radical SAM enzyme
VGSIDDRSVSILYTNGRFMDARTARALSRAGLFAAGVSFDSHVPEKLNSMRGDGRAFEYACAAVRNARAAGLYTIVQTVVLKSDLSRRYLFGLFRLAKRLGAHEVRILEPIASGHLLAAGDAGDVFYAPRDRRRLIRIQYAANRRPGFPKVTTFAHTESARQYGCGAGTQHSYVTASGELLPCDFVPLSFGSVLAREPAVLWREMNAAIGIPKSRCLAQDLAPTLVHHGAEGLPLGRERSEEICRSCRQSRYPRFYGYLQGN